MTTITQRRVAGATALMILMYLLQVALFASPSRADSHVDDPRYWEDQYPNAQCYKHGPVDLGGLAPQQWQGLDGFQNDHGELTDVARAVELHPFNPAWWGDHWELLVVAGWGTGQQVYEHPSAGQAYYPPAANAGKPFVSYWIVCKGDEHVEPGLAEVSVRADCVLEEEQAYFYADVLVNATLLVDLTGDGDFDDSGAGEKAVSPGNPGFIHPDTPPGGEIAWEATANPNFEFEGGEKKVSGTVTVPDCSTPPTTEGTTPTTEGTTPTTEGTTPTTQGTTPTTQGTTPTTQGTTPTTQATTIPFDSLPESDDASVLGTTITTAPEEVSADTLPFTGFESGDALKLGLLALLAGGLMLFAVRGVREEETPASADLGGWSAL